ncbi:MAG: hypothetical protein ACLQUZ_14210 [Rhizomicrobium sp.]
MATTYEGKAVLEMETTGSTVEAGAAIAVVVLAIIGLARADTGFMTSIATIVLGTALLLYGATIAAGYSKLLTMVTGGTLGAVELGGGMTVEILAGGSAIVLGILGLIGFSPEILLPCAVMAVGAALILSASGVQRLSTLRVEAAGLSEMAQNISQSAVIGAISAQVLAGGAAIVLGILALTTSHAPVLTLIGLLVLGASVAVSGTALTGRMLRLFNHKTAQ